MSADAGWYSGFDTIIPLQSLPWEPRMQRHGERLPRKLKKRVLRSRIQWRYLPWVMKEPPILTGPILSFQITGVEP